MTAPNGRTGKTVVVFEDGLRGAPELSSVVEATLRHASQAYRVVVATSEAAVADTLASSEPVLLIVDADRLDARRFERLVAGLRTGGSLTRWLPILAMVVAANLPSLQEALPLGLVDFILKPFEPDELWGRVRVILSQAAAVADLVSRNEELSRLAVTDSLTGLSNAAFIVERCDQEVSRAKRYDQSVSCLLIDIDNFKAVNDTYGHPVGNEVLLGLAKLIRSLVRGSDVVGRYGGEEFLLVLPQTDQAGAIALAERLRQAVEATTFRIGLHEVGITVSVGVATFPGPGVIGRETLFLAVDRAVYRAKSLGRNRVAWLDGAGDALTAVSQSEEDKAVE